MPLPDSIRIGPYMFRRELRDPGEENDGLCECEQQLISVRPGLSAQYERVVRLHEVLHAMWFERGLGEGATEERVCEALSTALCAAYPDFDP